MADANESKANGTDAAGIAADIIGKELSAAGYQSLLGVEQSGISVNSRMDLQNTKGNLCVFPLDKEEHCLQENILVVTVRDRREAGHFEIPEELVMQVRNSEFRDFEPETELAFRIADRYISIQEVSGGYDYTVYDMDFRELDGGVYDKPDITIREALDDIAMDLKQPAYRSKLEGSICDADELIPVDYGRLTERAEQVAKNELESHIRKNAEDSRTERYTLEKMTKEYVLRILREEPFWTDGKRIRFFAMLSQLWEFTLQKEDAMYSPHKYRLTGNKIGSHETWARRYVSISAAFLHIINNLNENADTSDKYKSIDTWLLE